jgi:hypothetical protein
MKDTDHRSVHGSFHLPGERKFYGTLRLRFARRNFGPAEKSRAGATPTIVATETVVVTPAQPAASRLSWRSDVRVHDLKQYRKGDSMSIINRPPEMVKREYELQEPTAHAVEKYALFIQSTPDHVVNSALKMVIWKDAEFRRWRKQQQGGSERKEQTPTTKAAKA